MCVCVDFLFGIIMLEHKQPNGKLNHTAKTQTQHTKHLMMQNKTQKKTKERNSDKKLAFRI